MNSRKGHSIKWKCYLSYLFQDEQGRWAELVVKLHKTGLYGIVNNNPYYRAFFTPIELVQLERKLKRAKERGEIIVLELKMPITVIEKGGFYVELKEDKDEE